jgi:hypothetical protein
MSKTSPYTPLHYTLISAEITFQLPEDPEIYTQRLNGVLADALPEITAKLIGKAQQIVQLQFRKRMDNSAIEILDVVILNLTALGRMTELEFQGTSKNDKVGDKVVVQPKHLKQDDPFTSA